MGDLAAPVRTLALLGLSATVIAGAISLGTVAATIWFERVYLPRLNFEEPTKPIDYRGWPQ